MLKTCLLPTLLLCTLNNVALADSQLLGARLFNQAGDVLITYNGAGQQSTSSFYKDGSAEGDIGILGFEDAYEYNEHGWLKESSVSKGIASNDTQSHFTPTNPIRYDYNDTHRLTSVSLNSDVTHYQYYVGGSPIEKEYTNGAGQIYTIGFEHDVFTGQKIKESYKLNTDSNEDRKHSLSYRYNNNGLKTVAYHGAESNSPDWRLTYEHDVFGRIESIKRNEGDLGQSYHTYNIFDEYGDLKQISIGTSIENPILTYTYHYNVSGNIHQIDIDSNTDSSFQRRRESSPLNKMATGINGSSSYKYTYNHKNQLTGFTARGHKKLLPQNDFGSRIKSQEYSYGLNNNIQTVTTNLIHPDDTSAYQDIAAYAYDETEGHPNRLISVEHTGNYWQQLPKDIQQKYSGNYSYHINGQIHTDPWGGAYQYNNRNQLILYQQDLSGTKQTTVNYAYNPHGLLSKQTSQVDGIPNPRGAVYSFYQGHYPIFQLQEDKDQKYTNSSFHLKGLASFRNTNQQEQPAQTIEDLYSVKQGNIALTTLNNRHSGPRSEPRINSGGNPVIQINHQYLYTPYGIQSDILNLVSPNTSPLSQRNNLDITKNSTGYTGQKKDQATGFMMLGGFRNYDPVVGRFIQIDTYTPFSKTAVNNAYAYVKSNPVMATDPSGHNELFGLRALKTMWDDVDPVGNLDALNLLFDVAGLAGPEGDAVVAAVDDGVLPAFRGFQGIDVSGAAATSRESGAAAAGGGGGEDDGLFDTSSSSDAAGSSNSTSPPLTLTIDTSDEGLAAAPRQRPAIRELRQEYLDARDRRVQTRRVRRANEAQLQGREQRLRQLQASENTRRQLTNTVAQGRDRDASRVEIRHQRELERLTALRDQNRSNLELSRHFEREARRGRDAALDDFNARSRRRR